MGLKLCGAFTVETLDADADKFLVKGMSVEAANTPVGIANSDHKKDFVSIVGKTFDVRKIFTDDDCRTPQELRIFKKGNSLPIVFGCVELFDEMGHGEAKAIAQIAEFYKSKDEPSCLNFSIEVEPVSIIEKGVYSLSALKRVAITYKPVNAAAICEVLEDQEMLKSQPEIQKSINPSDADERMSDMIGEIYKKTTIFAKALEAGYAVGAPGTNVQGAALQKQNLQKKAHVVNIPDETTDVTHEESSTVIHDPNAPMSDEATESSSSSTSETMDLAKSQTEKNETSKRFAETMLKFRKLAKAI